MHKYVFHYRIGPRPAHTPGRLWRRRLLLPLGILAGFLVLATFGYWLIEAKYTLLDAVYMTVITVGTVGYGEVGEGLSGAGRLWSIFVIVVGMVIVAVALSGVVAVVVEGQVRGIFGRRQLQHKIASLDGHVIVCGYGRTGSLVAESLTAGGKQVIVVDNDPQRTAAAEEAGLLYVLGDAEEEETLREAGLDRADALVSVLPTDAANVFVTLSARQASESLRIVSRAQEASSESKLRKAGATRVICPKIIGARRMARVVLWPAVEQFVEMTQTGDGLEVEQIKLRPGLAVVGRTIRELALPRRAGIYIIGMQRADGSTLFQPTADVELAVGDTLILVGQAGAAKVVEGLVIEDAPAGVAAGGGNSGEQASQT